MDDIELSLVNNSGDLNDIQLGGVTSDEAVLTQAEVDAKIAAAVADPETVDFIPQSTGPTTQEGRTFYDESKHSFSYFSDIPDVTINTAVEQVIRGVNRTGVTLLNGTPVRYAGIDGATNLPMVVAGVATTFENAHIAGVLTHEVADNEECWVTVLGLVGDVNIISVMESGQTMTPGAKVYLSATEPGKLTHDLPDIAVPLGGFFSGIQGSEPGDLFVRIYGIQNLPDVTGFMQGQNTPLYSVTTTPLTILDYEGSGNIILPVSAAQGTISTLGEGVYDLGFTGSFSFSSNSGTRSIYIAVYDVTNATEKFHYTIAIPRDATEVGGSFVFPFNSTAAIDFAMQISASENIDVTIEAVSFGLTSKHIR